MGYLAKFVDENGDSFYGKNKQNVVKWIQSFANLHPTQKQEWSEEDWNYITDLISYFDGSSLQHDTPDVISWLKSLRPQKQWKPSDEMLEALYRVIPENVMEKSEDEMLLDKLYQGLKYGKVLSKN